MLGASVRRLLSGGVNGRTSADLSLQETAQVMVDEAATLIPDCEVVITAVPVEEPGFFRVIAACGPWATTLLGQRWPLEGTLNGRAMLSGRVIESVDAPGESRLPEIFTAGGIRAGRLVPVTSAEPLPDGRIAMAVMSFWRRDAVPFSPGERQLIDTFSRLAGMSLIRSESMEATVRIAERLRAGVDVAMEVGSSLDPGDVVRRLLERAVEAVHADRALLARIDGTRMVIEGHHDLDGGGFEPGRTFPIPADIQRIIDVGLPTLEAPRGFRAVTAPASAVQPVRHRATVPLMAGGRVYALLSVARRAGEAFSATDLDLLQQIGNIAVLALRNAALYADAQAAFSQARDAHEVGLRTLAEVSRHVATVDPTPELFGRLAGTVAELVGARRVAFLRYDSESQTLRLKDRAFGLGRKATTALRDVRCVEGSGSLASRVVFEDYKMNVDVARPEPGMEAPADWMVAMGMRNYIVVPWKAGGTRLGMICAYDSISSAGFTTEDLWILEVAALAAGLVWQHKESETQLRDMAESEAEVHREHAERMAALEEVKSEFLNLASHELRGPLAVLRGYVSMLADGTLGADDLDRVVPVLAGKVEQMNLLVNEMLETARLEEGRIEIDLRPHDLRDLLERAVNSIRPVLSERHQLRIRVPDQPVPVRVDSGRIETVLGNLLDNAIKYSPQGGMVRCTMRVHGNHVSIGIADAGIGIAPGDMSKLFMRFGRLVTKDNSHISGTGLGLYLSQELARMNSGVIRARSRPGLGSTFTLTVPLDLDRA